MLVGLLGEHAEVATLANSSALDERWQTDLPNFMHQWLRLLSVHQPAQMTRYISLVTQGTQVAAYWYKGTHTDAEGAFFLLLVGVGARRPDAVCVVAQVLTSLAYWYKSANTDSQGAADCRSAAAPSLLGRSCCARARDAPRASRLYCALVCRGSAPVLPPRAGHPTRRPRLHTEGRALRLEEFRR
jgi:hypothetical protein